MIKNIIFDFGDVFINLDKAKFALEMQRLGISEKHKKIKFVLDQYEMGLLTTASFLTFFKEELNIPATKLTAAWNSILQDFPLKRLQYLKELKASKKYRLFLLSNTNDMHITWIQENWGQKLYKEFKGCYEVFYLSYEIHYKKPNNNIYEFVLNENDLKPAETLFVDDTKENTDTAKELGIHVWNIIPQKEDVTDLLTKKANLF